MNAVVAVFPKIGRVVINKGENKFTDFRKVNEPVKILKYSRKNILAKGTRQNFLNHPKLQTTTR